MSSSRQTKRVVAGIVAALALVAAVVVAAAWYKAITLTRYAPAQREAFARAHPELDDATLFAEHDLHPMPVTLTTTDDFKLHAYYTASRNRAAVVLVHGYRDPIADMIPVGAVLAKEGYGALWLQLRAHGESDGSTITFGRDEPADLAAAVAYLRERPEVDAERVGLFGNSLGGVIAMLYAADNPSVAAVAAQSPYATLNESVDVSVRRFTGLPPFPFAHLIRFFVERRLGVDLDELAPVHKIAAIAPRGVLILSGGADTYIDPAGGRRLAEAGGEGTELWFDPELDHVEFVSRRSDEFAQRVPAFFDRYLKPAHEGNEASMHRLLEEQLQRQSVQVSFHITAEGVITADLSGELWLAPDNRVRLEATGNFAGSPAALRLISDGRSLQGRNGDKRFEQDTPPDLTRAMALGFTRMGLLHNLARLTGGAAPDHAEGGAEDWVQVGPFSPAEDRDRDGVPTAGMKFALTVSGEPAGTASLWLDDDGAPRERRQSTRFSQGEMRVVERYTQTTWGPVDAARFRLEN